MRVLYVDMQYDYGIKSRGKNAIGLDGFMQSFEDLGHEVVPFYYDEYLEDTATLQEKLKAYADEVKPDLLFFCLFQDQFAIETLAHLKSKYTTVNWFGDDQWRFERFTKKYAPYFTYCVTTDKFAMDKYKQIGQPNVIYSQWAAINEHRRDSETPAYEYEVSFVGGVTPERRWFVEELQRRGINISAFGYGWENGPLSSDEMNALFGKTKINLNLSNSTSYDIRFLLTRHNKKLKTWLGKFIRSPRVQFQLSFLLTNSKKLFKYFQKSKSVSQIKARNFEIPFFGGFQLTEYVPSLEEYFAIGEEVVCFNSIDDAELLIRYYLAHDDEREAIRKAGNIKAVNSHGYINRIEAVLKEIKQ